LHTILSAQACSSPAVSFMVRDLNARGGIMITASHNPPEFNGVKIKAHYGGSASPAIMAAIERNLRRLRDTGDQPRVSKSVDGIEKRDFRPRYFAHLSSLIDLDRIRRAGLTVVIDPMHGSGSGYLPAILGAAGCGDVIEIRSEHNPVFGGINPEPVTQNMQALYDAVLATGASIGIALDGDADRVGAADSQGRFVDCHRIFTVLLKHLVETRGWTGDVVKTLSTTRMIDKLAAKYGLRLYETPIGFKHVCDLMIAGDILIGGEESGGIGVKNHIPERDGVLMGLLLLEAVACRDMRLDQLIDEVMSEVGVHEYDRIDMHPGREAMQPIAESLKSCAPGDVAEIRVESISRIDGTKINLVDGSWLLLRPSGTEPVVRIYAESHSKAQVKALLETGVTLVNAS